MKVVNAMKKTMHTMETKREHHPRVGMGLFLIVLGLVLLVATNDFLGLGSIKEYFTWETVLVYIGVLLLLNLHFSGGLILLALGVWFFLINRSYDIPEIIRVIYWPSLIILIGLGFIISSLFKKRFINSNRDSHGNTR